MAATRSQRPDRVPLFATGADDSDVVAPPTSLQTDGHTTVDPYPRRGYENWLKNRNGAWIAFLRHLDAKNWRTSARPIPRVNSGTPDSPGTESPDMIAVVAHCDEYVLGTGENGEQVFACAQGACAGSSRPALLRGKTADNLQERYFFDADAKVNEIMAWQANVYVHDYGTRRLLRSVNGGAAFTSIDPTSDTIDRTQFMIGGFDSTGRVYVGRRECGTAHVVSTGIDYTVFNYAAADGDDGNDIENWDSTSIDMAADESLKRLVVNADGAGVAVGGKGPDTTEVGVLFTTDDATAGPWTRQTIPASRDNPLVDVAFDESTGFWMALSRDNGPMYSGDLATWTPCSGVPAMLFSSVNFRYLAIRSDGNGMWMLAVENAFTESNAVEGTTAVDIDKSVTALFVSDDMGATWHASRLFDSSVGSTGFAADWATTGFGDVTWHNTVLSFGCLTYSNDRFVHGFAGDALESTLATSVGDPLTASSAATLAPTLADKMLVQVWANEFEAGVDADLDNEEPATLTRDAANPATPVLSFGTTVDTNGTTRHRIPANAQQVTVRIWGRALDASGGPYNVVFALSHREHVTGATAASAWVRNELAEFTVAADDENQLLSQTTFLLADLGVSAGGLTEYQLIRDVSEDNLPGAFIVKLLELEYA